MPLTKAEAEELEFLELENERAKALQAGDGLESLSDGELEKITRGDLEGLSDKALQIVANGGKAPDAPSTRQIPNRFMGGMAGQDTQSGFTYGNLLEELGRYGPGLALSTAGGMAGGPLGVAAGAGAAKALQNTVQNAYSAQGYAVPEVKASEAVASPLEEAGLNYLGAKVLAPAMEYGGGKAWEVLKSLYKRMGQTGSGISEQAYERLLAHPKEVMSALSRDPESPAAGADALRSAVKENISKASKAYDDLVSGAVKGTKYAGKTFDLEGALGKDVAAITEDFGFGRPDRLGPEARLADRWQAVSDMIAGKSQASAQDAYYLQRDLGRMVRDEAGTSLGAAAKRLQGTLREYLGREIPEIGQANSIYRKAMQVEDELSGITGAQNLPGRIARAFRQNTPEVQALENAADNVQGLGPIVEALRDAMAGQEFAPWVASLPRTGMIAGMGYGASQMASSPGAAVAGAAMLPFLSPRVFGTMTGAAVRAGRAIAPHLPQAGTFTRPIAGQTLADLYDRQR